MLGYWFLEKGLVDFVVVFGDDFLIEIGCINFIECCSIGSDLLKNIVNYGKY